MRCFGLLTTKALLHLLHMVSETFEFGRVVLRKRACKLARPASLWARGSQCQLMISEICAHALVEIIWQGAQEGASCCSKGADACLACMQCIKDEMLLQIRLPA